MGRDLRRHDVVAADLLHHACLDERAERRRQEPRRAELDEGKIVTVGGSLEFDQFNTDLGDSSMSDLNRILAAIKKVPNRVIVRGHSFAEPVRRKPQFRDQHDLSFARARSVAKYLIENDIDPNRILVSAAGDAEPRIVTRNIEDRRHNRRVDIFTIDSYLAPPDPG